MHENIIVLGTKGMLGQMVHKFFSDKNFNVIAFNERFSSENILDYVDALNVMEDSIIINCIGRIKQKSEDPYQLFLSNSLLPLEILRRLKKSHIFIHPSTDCVFNGFDNEPYFSFIQHTAKDVYGISKSLGETAIINRENSLIIRVSIIGPDSNSSKGLLEWFLHNRSGSILNGYTNHLWNGITTLEWCEKLHSFMKDKILFASLLEKKIIQLGTQKYYSKFEMLVLFNNLFQKNYVINPIETEIGINRCLIPEISSVSLEEQLQNLINYLG